MNEQRKVGGPKQKLTDDAMKRRMPSAATLGAELVSATPDRVEGWLAWSPERCRANGVLHGGVLMALADNFGGVCAFLNLPPGAGTATIESKTNLLRGLREGHVSSISSPLHVGRLTIVVQTDVFDANGKRVAQTTQTQAVIHRDRN